jgi:hypothetical protein
VPGKRVSMRKTREVLRLYFELKLGQRQITCSANVSQSTVHDYVTRFTAAGSATRTFASLTKREESKYAITPVSAKARLVVCGTTNSLDSLPGAYQGPWIRFSIRSVSTHLRTLRKHDAFQVSKRKLSQGRGSLYVTVDDFVAARALRINRTQQRSTRCMQLFQSKTVADYRFQ